MRICFGGGFFFSGQCLLEYNGATNDFKFDRVFGQESTQEAVFDEVKHFVQSALDGYNVSLLAYGQTGAGKTHTMLGGAGMCVCVCVCVYKTHTLLGGAGSLFSKSSMFYVYREDLRIECLRFI
jgi:hypothetical protein